jgi:hypothetical protein
MRRLALLAVLAVSPVAAAAAESEQVLAAERLAARAQDALDGILGPGRSKVEIDVAGEHSELNTDAQFLFPMDTGPRAPKAKAPPPAAQKLTLPGYVDLPGMPGHTVETAIDAPRPEPAPAPAPSSSHQLFQEEHEASRRDQGFLVKSVHATVVLDSALDDGLVREASQLLPQLLALDMTRGDTLSILRATLRPAWKSAFSTPGDWRTAAYALGGGLVALLAALIVFAGLVGAGRALGRSLGQELSTGRSLPEPVSAEALPEISAGTAGFLEAESSRGGSAPLLGRRFDFLVGRDSDLVVRALSAERPEDLSLFFGHLSESIPDLASRLFTHLSSDLQAEVSQSLLKLSVADPDRLTAIEERMRQAVENGVLGSQSLGRILSRVPGNARADLLGRLDARDAEAVERHMFSFEDLENLGPAPLRRLIVAVPFETWGPALRGAPGGLVEAVLQDLPEGPSKLVRAASSSPQPREKVEEARARILDAYAALEATGDLAVGGARRGEDLV